jgi:hypothetical protein
MGLWLELGLALIAEQSRVDALLRVVGFIVFGFGAAIVYYSYANSNVGIAPEIITVNYALGALLVVVGLLAAFAKFK